MKVSGPLCLHMLYLVFEHTLDFVAHGFGAGIAEMDAHLVGGRANFLYHRGGILRRSGTLKPQYGMDVSNGHPLPRLQQQHPLHRVQTLQPAGEGGVLPPSFRSSGRK